MTKTPLRNRPLALLSVAALIAAGAAVTAPQASGTGTAKALEQLFNVDAGDHHTVMIAGDGTPWGVGRNQSGQLCNGTLDQSSTYTAMVGLPVGRKAVQVRAGSQMSVVLDDMGVLRGCGVAGSVDLGATLDVLPGIPAGRRVSDVAVGASHVVAILDDGRVFGLGRGTEGQISGTQDRASFAEVAGLSPLKAVDVAAAWNYTLVVDEYGEVRGTGLNTAGQLGGLPVPTTTLSRIGNQPAGVDVVQVGAGTSHALMLGSNGYVYAQGSNVEGQLGNGTSGGSVSRWVRMRGASDVVWIDGGTSNTVVVTRAGTPLTAGANADGQQGFPAATIVRNTELTEFGTDYFDVPAGPFAVLAAGGGSVIGRSNGGHLFGAGNNAYHQIRSFGTDDVESLRRLPQQVVRGSGGARITGTLRAGQTLKAEPGRWTPSAPMSFQYQWKRDGVAVQQSSSSQYVLASADIGRTISVQVFSNLQGSDNSSSAPVLVRVPGVNLTRPVISGTPRVGKVLRATKGTWNAPGYTFKFRWLRNGRSIPGATRASYRLVRADRLKQVSVRVTAVRSGFLTLTVTSGAKRALRSR